MRIYSCIPVIPYVENVDQDPLVAEAEEAEAEGPEQQPQEFEVADQVEGRALDSNSANPDLQQGKHRFIYPSILHKFKFMQAPDQFNPVSYIL